MALFLFILIVLVTSLQVVADPLIATLVLLSVVPAIGLAAFIWWADIGTEEPLFLLAITLLLGGLFASFAAILNGIGWAILAGIPVVSTVLFYYLVVGPVEEGVKLLAVKIGAFRHHRFDAVIDGAVYGAMAGLGFAMIENAVYITDAVEMLGTPEAITGPLSGITAARAMAGPGHVIYSAIAGFYLGLAKFNRPYAGALIIKGITIAAVIHATYNVLLYVIPGALVAATGMSVVAAFLVYILIYDGLAAYFLYRKLAGYRRAYRAATVPTSEGGPDRTEFERSLQ